MMKHAFLKLAMCVCIATAAWAQDAQIEIDVHGDDASKVKVLVDDQALIDDTDAAPAAPAGRWIGIGCDPVDDALRAHVDLPQGIGLLVLQVMPKSPALDAGIEKHDILVSAGDRKLGTRDDLVAAVAAAGGQPIEMTWMHRGAKVTKMVTPVERPLEYRAPQRPGAWMKPGEKIGDVKNIQGWLCLLYTSPSPRDATLSRMPSSA